MDPELSDSNWMRHTYFGSLQNVYKHGMCLLQIPPCMPRSVSSLCVNGNGVRVWSFAILWCHHGSSLKIFHHNSVDARREVTHSWKTRNASGIYLPDTLSLGQRGTGYKRLDANRDGALTMAALVSLSFLTPCHQLLEEAHALQIYGTMSFRVTTACIHATRMYSCKNRQKSRLKSVFLNF